MAVEDRVAFALMFLSDSKLNDYLKRLTQKLTEEGNLAGFLLTGMRICKMIYFTLYLFIARRHISGASMEGIQLLNRYLEITGDVQSCSLIAIKALTPKLLQENQVQVWIAKY